LIDSPSVIIAPEFTIISESSDGIILLGNLKVTYTNLGRITRILKDAETPLLGTIIREQNSILENDYSESVQRLNVMDIDKEESKVEV
jgi:hypothetical protein